MCTRTHSILDISSATGIIYASGNPIRNHWFPHDFDLCCVSITTLDLHLVPKDMLSRHASARNNVFPTELYKVKLYYIELPATEIGDRSGDLLSESIQFHNHDLHCISESGTVI